jgi:hypothetical protein
MEEDGITDDGVLASGGPLLVVESSPDPSSPDDPADPVPEAAAAVLIATDPGCGGSVVTLEGCASATVDGLQAVGRRRASRGRTLLKRRELCCDFSTRAVLKLGRRVSVVTRRLSALRAVPPPSLFIGRITTGEDGRSECRRIPTDISTLIATRPHHETHLGRFFTEV